AHLLLATVAAAPRLGAQTSADLQTFHDQAAALIGQLASRPLTPGDTFLTFSPDPGGLIHTIWVTPALVESSLLRADRMLGTARVEWSASSVRRFQVVWIRADTLRGSKVDSAITVQGEVQGDSIRISRPASHVLAVPKIAWAVADFGMEEQLIP